MIVLIEQIYRPRTEPGRLPTGVGQSPKRKENTMTNRTVFTGAATAIITPFSKGQVDYVSFGKIIEDQIAKKIDAIVVAGTTGEAATLTHEEHCE